MQESPSPNGRNGQRDARGRFAKGNKGGPGNPYARQVANVRSLILEMVSEEDLRSVIKSLITSAQAGNIQAARELLNRLVGRPPEGAEPASEETINRKLKLAERRLDLDEERHDNKMFGL